MHQNIFRIIIFWLVGLWSLGLQAQTMPSAPEKEDDQKKVDILYADSSIIIQVYKDDVISVLGPVDGQLTVSSISD